MNTSCGHRPWYLGAAGGGIVGAFVGLVGSKIRMSDWDNQSRTASGVQLRNQAIGGGAALGVIVGTLAFMHSSCGAASLSVGPASSGFSRREITAAEIQRAGSGGSAYDLVFALRPSWLNQRSYTLQAPSDSALAAAMSSGRPTKTVSDSSLVVYLNDMRLGSVSTLTEIPAAGVLSVVFYDAAQASLRWGGGLGAGAIQVITERRYERELGRTAPHPRK